MNAALTLVAFASALTCCAAIRCYECTVTSVGAGDSKCADPFYKPEPPYLRDCDSEIYKKCSKTKTYLANDKISIVRSCAEQDCVDKGCKTYDGQTVCHHCCYGDMCNGAGVLTFDFIVAVITVGLTFLLH
ncbi:uncharacterized protein LOC110982389 [Acanthaster planci]|uniref:Uncharacterized protein LOC110982389 n=1 Tax=Acanthaster planci TaxID=133434 RepID=A0A8B7YVD9_ACAPL|nr:uncharacterized protein LOC110982389 [Acanthaster planci]